MGDSEGDGGIERRQLLAAVAGAGGLGIAGGVATASFARDGELAGGFFRSGTLDLAVEWEEMTAPSGAIIETGDRLRLRLSALRDGGSGLLRLSLPDARTNNPASVWLQPTCPTDPALADALSIALYHADGEGRKLDEEPVTSGTLRDVAESPGVRLDFGGESGCLRPPGTGGGQRSPRYLRLEWELSRLGSALHELLDEGDDEPAFGIDLFARQCRHRRSHNPYPGGDCGRPLRRRAISYIEVWLADETGACDGPVGKLELSPSYLEACGKASDVTTDGQGTATAEPIGDSYVTEGRYALPVDVDEGACDSGYDIVITDTDANGEGETIGVAFEIVDPTGDAVPELCRVDIKAGPGVTTFTGSALAGNATAGILSGTETVTGGGEE